MIIRVHCFCLYNSGNILVPCNTFLTTMMNNRSKTTPIAPKVFSALYAFDFDELCEYEESLLRPVLPCLVRLSVCKPLDSNDDWTSKREHVLCCILGAAAGNSIHNYLSVDFAYLETDLKKEQHTRYATFWAF